MYRASYFSYILTRPESDEQIWAKVPTKFSPKSVIWKMGCFVRMDILTRRS